mmetsp:Transcript_74999/g.199166  ORF Transcript_74999/g.199166 Transcript_74999/m.199166 type:complete len:255 (+) Transcript_74999:306-1070(+)
MGTAPGIERVDAQVVLPSISLCSPIICSLGVSDLSASTKDMSLLRRPPMDLRWFNAFSIFSRRLSTEVRMNLRRFMTSLTVALLVPRSSSTLSIKSPKDNVCFPPAPASEDSSSSSWFPSKKRSVRSTRPTTSTPTSCSSLAAWGFSRIISYSPFVMLNSWPALEGKMVRSTSCNLHFTKATSKLSFSVDETAVTTSQSTPISMFIMVIEAIMTKRKKATKSKAFSAFKASMRTIKSSKNTPCMANEYIDWPTP